MTEGDRLGRLQVGESRHQRLGMRLGLVDQGALQVLQLADRPVAGPAHPQPEIQRHLVVARARRMQTPGRRSDELRKAGLHIHVNVFEFLPEGKGSGRQLRLDRGQALLDRGGVRRRDDPGGGQHGRVRARAGDVLRRQAPVEADRHIDRLHDRVRLGGEASAP